MGPRGIVTLLFATLAIVQTARPSAEPVPARLVEGTSHGFLVLRSVDGMLLAHGDQAQVMRGGILTNHLIFRFTDGSVDDSTTVFTQRGNLRLLTYHDIQKGPIFPHPIELRADTRSGEVVVTYTDDHGVAKTDTSHMELPADLSNGMMNVVLKNAQPKGLPLTLSYLAATPKPRIITLHVTSAGLDRFSAGGAVHKATHYVIKIDLGGVTGVLAPLLGKNPPDSHLWVYPGDAPVFVASETTLFEGGPSWRIEPANIAWPTH
jgi:hypothetical protein